MSLFIIQLHFVEYKRPKRVQISRCSCTPEDRLDGFPAVDQSVGWISRANSFPLRTLMSCIPRNFIKYPRNETFCCVVSLRIFTLCLCFDSPYRSVKYRTSRKILSDITQKNVFVLLGRGQTHHFTLAESNANEGDQRVFLICIRFGCVKYSV